MKREIVKLDGPPSKAPLAPAVKAGGFVYTSGNVGVNRQEGTVPEGVQAQTRQTLENLKEVLGAAGSSLDRVVKANIYLTDMADFQAMNEVYREYFPVDPPARTTVGISGLASDKLVVEIELIALA